MSSVTTTQDARKKFTMAEAQENMYGVMVAKRIFEVDTTKTGTVYNPYMSKPGRTDGVVTSGSSSYARGTGSIQADSLQINRRVTSAEPIDFYDDESIDLDIFTARGKEFGETIAEGIDKYMLNLPVGMAGVTALDAGDFGGSDGAAYTTSSSNMLSVLNLAKQKVHLKNTGNKRKFAVLSPYEITDLEGQLQNAGFSTADKMITDGFDAFRGTTVTGIDVYESNNLQNTVVLGLATNPTNGDTITINGVEITFVDTLSGGAGEVHIAGTVDVTRANLVEFLTGTEKRGDTSEAEGTNTGYSALSNEDSDILNNLGITVTNDNDADTMTLVAKGTVEVSETLTNGTDTWGTVSRQVLFGNYGAGSIYIPSSGMRYKEKDIDLDHAVELYMAQIYNGTFWTRKKDEIVTIKVA